MTDLAYVNGEFLPAEKAVVSIDDRGLQFGDGIYEVIAVYEGKPFLLDRHMARLRTSAAAIQLAYNFDLHPLEPIIFEGLRRRGLREAMVYLQLTRGTAPRSHVIPAGLTPTVVMTFRALARVPEDQRARGARLMTTRDTRWEHCYIKAITLLPNVLARNEAITKGFDDALYVNPDGEMMECTSANIFLVQGPTLLLPVRTESILHGITQAFLIECAESIGLRVDERACPVNMLAVVDEALMSSTTVEVLAVTSVDHRPIGTGRVGPIARRLHEAYRAHIAAHLARG